MTEHNDHEAKTDDVEKQLDEMEQRSGRLKDEIEDTGDDWERKKRDPAVPGAAGMPDKADGPEPEAEYPAKGESGEGDGDGESSAEQLDFGKDEDVDAGGASSGGDDPDEDGDGDPDDGDDRAS
jgi:hypothetical protein